MAPLDAVAGIIVGIYSTNKKTKVLQQWLTLLFQMFCSGVITFMFTAGTTMITSKSLVLSIGTGLISTAVILTVYLRTSPLTKGMMFVLPAQEAKEEINTNVQVIQK